MCGGRKGGRHTAAIDDRITGIHILRANARLPRLKQLGDLGRKSRHVAHSVASGVNGLGGCRSRSRRSGLIGDRRESS